MNPLNYLNPMEQQLCNRADLKQIPIAGNIELLPLCNMDCKMCFAKMTRDEMERHAPMHSWKEWLSVAEQAKDMGMLFLLLTGGEPFLYPDFKKLYLSLKDMGIFVSINSNGTLITEEIAKYLSENPPRRINITLYGASDATYKRLCGNPHGFTQVMRGVELLKKYHIDVKFNCSLTPYNKHDFDAICNVSEKLDIPIEFGYYMFPPVRENNIGNEKYRLSPQEAALMRVKIQKYQMKEQFADYTDYSLAQYHAYEQKDAYVPGFTCRSGNSVFWINYDGTMSACSFTQNPLISVFENDFSTAWTQLVDTISHTYLSKKCHECKKRILCGRCAAAAESETGNVSGVPDYYCQLTDAYLQYLYKIKKGEPIE